ncbi:hypothetical protein GPALN_010866 [Globodera pallida]|nr:hypothetical protein GPALN_010866 [Globodera pallida]
MGKEAFSFTVCDGTGAAHRDSRGTSFFFARSAMRDREIFSICGSLDTHRLIILLYHPFPSNSIPFSAYIFHLGGAEDGGPEASSTRLVQLLLRLPVACFWHCRGLSARAHCRFKRAFTAFLGQAPPGS